MKSFRISLPLIAAALLSFALPAVQAQAPAGTPAGATGVCNDGSYWTGTTRAFSCRGHKGLKTWFGPAAATPAGTTAAAKPQPPVAVAKPAAPTTTIPAATPSKPAPLPSVASAAAKTPAAAKAPMQQAAGGGAGMVWVNTPTKVYHCPGDRYYGKTKDGKYMSEADAKAMGARGEGGKSCTK